MGKFKVAYTKCGPNTRMLLTCNGKYPIGK